MGPAQESQRKVSQRGAPWQGRRQIATEIQRGSLNWTARHKGANARSQRRPESRPERHSRQTKRHEQHKTQAPDVRSQRKGTRRIRDRNTWEHKSQGPESKENTGVQNQTKALLKLSVETAPPLEGCLSQGLKKKRTTKTSRKVNGSQAPSEASHPRFGSETPAIAPCPALPLLRP